MGFIFEFCASRPTWTVLSDTRSEEWIFVFSGWVRLSRCFFFFLCRQHFLLFHHVSDACSILFPVWWECVIIFSYLSSLQFVIDSIFYPLIGSLFVFPACYQNGPMMMNERDHDDSLVSYPVRFFAPLIRQEWTSRCRLWYAHFVRFQFIRRFALHVCCILRRFI